MRQGDFSDIRRRNLSVEYPEPQTSEVWEDPGRHLGIHEKYRHPEGDFLKDGFAPPMLEMTDHTVIEHEGRYHIFATAQTPGAWAVWEGQHHYIFHASTADFIDYEMHPVVLYNHPDHPYESRHCWPPFVFRYEDTFVMIYCGMDADDCQCLCMAFSDDLTEWQRYGGNPIITPGHLDWTFKRPDGKSRHCRDPHVQRVDEWYLLYYTAFCADGYSGVGLAASKDLVRWEDLGPCFKRDASSWLAESPLVIERKGKYYLLPSATPGIQCFESDDPTDFHHKRQLEVINHGITAPEVIDTRFEDRYLIGYHGDEGKRYTVGIMHWEGDRVRIERITEPAQLEPWGLV